MKTLYSIVFLVFWLVAGNSQDDLNDTVKVHDGSFEIMSLDSSKWVDLGDTRFSPPDLHTPKEIVQNVKSKAYHGQKYLSMVVRENDTQEQIGQLLEAPLEIDQAYQLTFHTMKSSEYLGLVPSGNEDSFFLPIHLMIYGYYELDSTSFELDPCGGCRGELLFKSDLINSKNWKEQVAIIKPKTKVNFLLFKAFYKTPVLIPYNGHLLLDNISHLVKIKD